MPKRYQKGSPVGSNWIPAPLPTGDRRYSDMSAWKISTHFRRGIDMKVAKMVAAVGLTLVLGAGLAACGAGYTGEGIVKDKEVVSKRKSTSKTYKVTIDVPNTDVNQVITLPKTQYDSVQVGQNVKVEDGDIKQ
jgi:hypothetical protein